MYLTNQAAYDYLQASEICYKYRLISFIELMKRIEYLRNIIAPHNPLSQRLDKRIKGFQTKFPESNLVEEEFEFDREMVKCSSNEVHSCLIETKVTDNNNSQNQEEIYFITKSKGIYCKWEFHKGDADPNPSVPHGHGIGKKYIKYKLDSYRGLIYDRGLYKSRENKEFIIGLWNNDKFREFALQAISHFKHNNPKYEFRVKDPEVLPRKRGNYETII